MANSVRVRADGLQITLSAIKGLTVDPSTGTQLLTSPLVLQCPPMEEFAVTRQFTTGNYDTITGTSYTRRGSKQLRVWQFDTLAMRMGVVQGTIVATPGVANPNAPIPAGSGAASSIPGNARLAPGWIPFPMVDGSGVPLDPSWYAQQIGTLHDSGAPFKFVGAYTGVARPLIHCYANILQYNESYEAGEDDAIYFKGLSFSEWRDPNQPQTGLGTPKGQKGLPTSVELDLTFANGVPNSGLCKTTAGVVIGPNPSLYGTFAQTTPVDLAQFFYGEASDWRLIVNANNLTGGAGNTPLYKFPRFLTAASQKYKLTIPARTTGKMKTLTTSQPKATST
jgi:hypothetical protein